MTFISFIISILWLISFDILCGFGLFIVWKYFDLKYFSTSEISLLREENAYLKQENKKLHGTSDEFWQK